MAVRFSQSITGGEDWNYLIRLFWAEINGIEIERYKWDEIVKNYTMGCLIMDSKGIYDAATRNESPLHGAARELAMSWCQRSSRPRRLARLRDGCMVELS